MEIKRNIFESPAKMPKQYEPVATAMCQEDTREPKLVGSRQFDHHTLHARSPRIGEK